MANYMDGTGDATKTSTVGIDEIDVRTSDRSFTNERNILNQSHL